MTPEARAKVMQARDLLARGAAEQAAAMLVRALSRSANDPHLNAEMGRILATQGQFDRSLYFLDRAARAGPNDPDLLSLLGSVQLLAGRPAVAEQTLARALDLRPSHAEALSGRVNALLALDRPTDAAAVARAGLVHHPDEPELARPLAYALLTSAHAEEATELLRSAVARHPDSTLLAGALATALNYCPGAGAAEVLAAHVAHGRLLRQTVRGGPVPEPAAPPTTAEADRPLQIGLLSPDLRQHPCAFFIEPLLAHLDRREYAVTCYSLSNVEDAVTARLNSLAAAWRPCFGLSDPDIAARIRSDRIDILLDVGGLTTNSRAGVLVLRPAPLQINWLGYPATTGLSEVQLRLVDRHTDPPRGPAQTVERLVQLDPCFLCYRPSADAPEPGPAPEVAAGRLTFGSFNAIQKLNGTVIDTWARVLRAVPDSRLVLKTSQLADAKVRADVLTRFERAGATLEQIELLPRTGDLRSHLAQYAMVDIALDTFPYCGTTTTCDALHMGVPVVTLAGQMHAGRVGVSLLGAVGLGELVATSVDDYARAAQALAVDRPRRLGLRASLRQTMAASPLRDEPAFASRFQRALRDNWRALCRGAGA